jgi:diguanylate cyclase (GGDEF)-like protein
MPVESTKAMPSSTSRSEVRGRPVLLVQVAERLRGLVRPSDTIARFGGDEFAVLVDDMSADDDGTGLAERITESMRTPFELQSEPVHVAASIGIARPELDSADAEQLLRNADLAMYQAKAARAGGHALYDPGMHAGLVERCAWRATCARR